MSTKIETIDIEEKTIDAAIEVACREFGVPRNKLNIEIISEGNRGFLGMLAKKAKIRASLLSLGVDVSFDLKESDNTPAKKEENPPVKEEAPAVKTEIPKAPPPPEKIITKTSPEKQEKCEKYEKIEKQTSPSSIPTITAANASELAPKAKEILEGILKGMSFECRIAINETPEKLILNIEGDGSGLLIGKRGQNLDAIQYILNKAINRSDSERKMIIVDSEAYRKRREESLLILAERIREKVKKTKKPVSLSNMNAHDRRIIHLALQKDEALMTKSRGEGEYRKIVILPAKKSHSPARARIQEQHLKEG
ncbi:MAG: RNA-binding cell elongation regulator Jag/EloR [Smithella sp.]